MNTDRNPANPALVTGMVQILTALSDDATPDVQEAVAKALLDMLLEQGVLNPSEHADAWLEVCDPTDKVVAVTWGDAEEVLYLSIVDGELRID